MTQTNNENNIGSGTQNFYIDKELIAILKEELSNKNKHIEELLRLVK